MYTEELDPELQPWVELLRSPHVNDRLVAVKTLQHLGDEGAIDFLLEALQDENPAVQKLAVTALWEFANPVAVPALIPCLASADAEVREEALSALKELVAADDLLQLLDALQQPNIDMQLNMRKIHDVQALPFILPFFKSEQPSLREAAVTTLRYLNQVACCQPAIALLSDPEATVRRATALTLGHLNDDEGIPALCQALITDPDWQVRRNAAQSLAFHNTPEAIPALGQALQDDHWQVRKFAARALQTTADDRVLPLLVQALTDEYADVRRDVAVALGHLGDVSVLPALHQTLDDPDMEVRIFSQRAIQQLQASTATPNV
jgi:HEAT repeat protein